MILLTFQVHTNTWVKSTREAAHLTLNQQIKSKSNQPLKPSIQRGNGQSNGHRRTDTLFTTGATTCIINRHPVNSQIDFSFGYCWAILCWVLIIFRFQPVFPRINACMCLYRSPGNHFVVGNTMQETFPSLSFLPVARRVGFFLGFNGARVWVVAYLG